MWASWCSLLCCQIQQLLSIVLIMVWGAGSDASYTGTRCCLAYTVCLRLSVM
jgi:hypothetical protein